MDNNKVLTMIEDEMPSVMKKCEKRYRLSEFWFYEDMRDWVFYGTIDILWHNLMTEYGAFTPGKEFKCAEEALAGLLRRGCNKDNFYFPNIQKFWSGWKTLAMSSIKGRGASMQGRICPGGTMQTTNCSGLLSVQKNLRISSLTSRLSFLWFSKDRRGIGADKAQMDAVCQDLSGLGTFPEDSS